MVTVKITDKNGKICVDQECPEVMVGEGVTWVLDSDTPDAKLYVKFEKEGFHQTEYVVHQTGGLGVVGKTKGKYSYTITDGAERSIDPMIIVCPVKHH